MYISSSSSSGEDESSEVHIHQIAPSYDAASFENRELTSQADPEDVESNTYENRNDAAYSPLHADARKCICPPHMINYGNENEEDDSTEISILKMEEKIVSLMNRVWILETENDVLRDQEDMREDIHDLYQNPYAGNDNDSGSPLKSKRQNFDELQGLSIDEHLMLNRSLKKDLIVSETVQERMRIAMVSLETRDKLRSDLIQELTSELEKKDEAEPQNVVLDLSEELEMEQFKTRQLQKELDEERTRRRKESFIRQQQSVEKECIDGSHESSAKAAQLVSDLTNELKLSMERESQLKDQLEATNRKLSAQARNDMTLQNTKREKDALASHNEELQALNIQLIRRFVALEKRHKEFVARTNQEFKQRASEMNVNVDIPTSAESKETNNSTTGSNPTKLTQDTEQRQKELTALKKRLALRKAARVEYKAGSFSAAKGVNIVRHTKFENEEDSLSSLPSIKSFSSIKSYASRKLSLSQEGKASVPDEQREDDNFTGRLGLNRFEI